MSRFRPNWLSDPRLAAQALSPAPAWLWRSDAAGILWANPTGAAVFHATPDTVTDLNFEEGHTAAAQVARLAGVLTQGGRRRLERLRGFGARFGGMVMCQCSRIALAGGGDAILVVSTERAGPDLALAERVRRLIGAAQDPVAAFSAEGELLYATREAQTRLAGAADLAALGAVELAQRATRDGEAEGEIAAGHLTLNKLGAGSTFVLLGAFEPAKAQTNTEAASPAAPVVAAPPVAPVAATDKRNPLRFLWTTDASERFNIESDELIRLIGPQSAGALGKPWKEIAAALSLDPQNKVAQALAARETFSGLTVEWPVDGASERLPVEMSGLPAFDRARNFEGYRGFGVCRGTTKWTAIAERRAATPAAVASTTPEPAATVVPFPEKPAEKAPEKAEKQAEKAQGPAPELTARERSAFHELARELSDRLKGGDPGKSDDFGPEQPQPITGSGLDTPAPAIPTPTRAANGNGSSGQRDAQSERPILDRLPIGILIYRLNDLIYANKAFLEWTGYGALDALNEAGGLDSLFIEQKATAGKNGKTLMITSQTGQQMPVEGRLFPITWNGDNALVLMLNTAPPVRDKTSELALRQAETEARELTAVLDTATDGVLLIDKSARVLSANRSAEALFGIEQSELTALSFGDLFAPESRRSVLDYLEMLSRGGAAALINEGREVVGRVKLGGLVPLHMTLGQVGEAGEKFCAVFRDVTAWKRTEAELTGARRQAESQSAAKSDFLAKISHEIRTPLNAIIGFSEVMMEERFGPIGNERYKQYLGDIHSSGGHLISLLNDLLDLSKIEAGKLELTFVSVNLNDLTQQCVAIMQQQANRERVIVRTQLAASLPQIVADARSVRQIVLNLLSNSIKFTGTGGQVIVSTALTDAQEVVLRVRDTGAGMSEQELSAALEPFRQLATSARWGSSGTGLGLPITKALAEANHAVFRISSALDDGTLVEVAFPATRVLA